MASDLSGDVWDEPDAWLSGRRKAEPSNPSDNFFAIDEEAMASMDVYDMDRMDSIMGQWRAQAHKKMKMKKTKSVEAKPIALDDMVETVGDTFVAGGTLVAEEDSHIPIPHAGSESASSVPPLVPHSLPTGGIKADAFSRARGGTSPAQLSTTPCSSDVMKTKTKDIWKPPSIKQVIDRILIGKPVVLEWYRSREEKKELLTEAISTHDGNTIITVVLFIQKTLSRGLFEAILFQFPVAAQHYCSFLRQNAAWEQLKAIYYVLGAESYGLLQYEMCLNIEDISARLKSLNSCQQMFSTRPQLAKEAVFVEEYAKLLGRQQKIESMRTKFSGEQNVVSVVDKNLIATLTYCCRYHYQQPDTKDNSPESLRKDFGVTDKQYFIVFLVSLCARKEWELVDRYLTPKGWQSKLQRTKVKAPVPVERIVRVMGKERFSIPETVLEKYVKMIEDPEMRMELATKYKCYGVGIETLKSMKNLEKLKKYYSDLPVERQRQYRPMVAKLFM